MKNVTIILIASTISMIIIVQIFFLLYASKPEMFTGAQIDSLNAANDSLHPLIVNRNDVLLPDSLIKNVQKDSLNKKTDIVKKDIQTTTPEVVEEHVDWKAKAKLIEAMNVDDATKIITTMDDKDVKALIDNLKKRTAAKILASMEPSRAAKILR
jgi:flagellar motility protein MotE (MotC chaperone)